MNGSANIRSFNDIVKHFQLLLEHDVHDKQL